jgi:hypothetical protein
VLIWPLFQEEIVRKRNGSFFSGLTIGVVAGVCGGLLAGAIGTAYSATGKKAWDRFGDMFQAGYITGFLDCVRIAKGMDQRGYIATNYTLPIGAKPSHFQAWINEEYKDPKAADRTLSQMLVLAGYKLEAKFGPEQAQTGSVSEKAMRSVIDARRRAIVEAEQAKKALEAAKAADAADAAKTGAKPVAPSGGTPLAGEGVETAPGEVPPAK